jgi:hypothetical protein
MWPFNKMEPKMILAYIVGGLLASVAVAVIAGL